MPFQPASVFHRLYKMTEDRDLDFLRPVTQNGQYVGSQFEHRYIVYVVADVPPRMAQPRNSLT